MKIDCFICNPPYNRICNKILESLKEKYVITINSGSAIMSKCYNKVTLAEYINKNYVQYNEWIKIYATSPTGLFWLVPTMLANTKYSYLVEEVSK